jgi:hypothetical protein
MLVTRSGCATHISKGASVSDQLPERPSLEERQRLLAQSAGELLAGQQRQTEFDTASYSYGPEEDAAPERKRSWLMRLLRRVAWGRA